MSDVEADRLDAVTEKLSQEFDGVLPRSLVASSVHTAVSPARAQPEVVEETARADLQQLAQAVTRSAGNADE